LKVEIYTEKRSCLFVPVNELHSRKVAAFGMLHLRIEAAQSNILCWGARWLWNNGKFFQVRSLLHSICFQKPQTCFKETMTWYHLYTHTVAKASDHQNRPGFGFFFKITLQFLWIWLIDASYYSPHLLGLKGRCKIWQPETPKKCFLKTLWASILFWKFLRRGKSRSVRRKEVMLKLLDKKLRMDKTSGTVGCRLKRRVWVDICTLIIDLCYPHAYPVVIKQLVLHWIV